MCSSKSMIAVLFDIIFECKALSLSHNMYPTTQQSQANANSSIATWCTCFANMFDNISLILFIVDAGEGRE